MCSFEHILSGILNFIFDNLNVIKAVDSQTSHCNGFQSPSKVHNTSKKKVISRVCCVVLVLTPVKRSVKVVRVESSVNVAAALLLYEFFSATQPTRT